MTPLHLIVGAHERPVHPAVRRVTVADLRDALVRGYADFVAMPSHAVFLLLIYPLAAIFVGGLTLGYNILPLAYPLMAGVALIGPLAAIGLYEMSRRREAGLDADISHTFDVLEAPSFPAIALLGLLLTGLFLAWVAAAQAIYESFFGPKPPASLLRFVSGVLTTPNGWKLIVIGNAVGFVFALAAFVLSVVSFPLLVDRDVGVLTAVATSVRTVLGNPLTMAIWGLIVAGLLLLGTLPFLAGLAVVIPVLGHASWHLYRKAVQP
ncbi:MAG TPA: DUF2189 domain-containing protein [Xanthobacteraceae bacterium]|nr:DUF2189 domain-containing protein [Xanthobacteraceae bacterium]